LETFEESKKVVPLTSATIRLLPQWKAPRWESNRKPFTQQT